MPPRGKQVTLLMPRIQLFVWEKPSLRPEGHALLQQNQLKTTTPRKRLSLCKSHSLLPRISYSSTSSAEPESENCMEPRELNWDPLSVATTPGRNATQPGHQWEWSERSLTAKGEVDSQVRPQQGGMQVKDGKHYGFQTQLHAITQSQQHTNINNLQYQISTLWSSLAAEFHRSLQHFGSTMTGSHQQAGRQVVVQTGKGQKTHNPLDDEPKPHYSLSDPISWQVGNRCLVRICWRRIRIFCLSSWISLSLSSSSSSS